MRLVDLSVPINEQIPVYPSDPPAKIEPAGVLERDGFTDHYVSLGTHVGTHVDAPMHMLKDGKSLDQIPLEQFVGRGRYIKVTDGFTLDTVQNADIQPGDVVLFHTGMSDVYHKPIYFEKYPVMSEKIAHYLVARKVRMVGVDAGSVDNIDGFPVHKILLKGGVLVIENLTNLDQVAREEFTVYALPLKLEIDASPARVIAQVKELTRAP